MPKRGPTDTDRLGPDDVEVVTAAQIKEREAEKASLLQRGKAKLRDTLSMTDERPPWEEGELADDQTVATGNPDVAWTCPAENYETGGERYVCDRHDKHDPDVQVGGHYWRAAANGNVPRPGAGGKELDDQPPAHVFRELRRRAHTEVEDRVGMAAAKVAGLVELDRWMRTYAVNVQHLASIAGLMSEVVEVLQARDLPNAELRGRFRQQIDEWDRDSEAGGS